MTDGGADLAPWIAELGRRLERGEWAVRVMLADLRHHDTLPPALADDPLIPTRRAALLADFRRLRAQIG